IRQVDEILDPRLAARVLDEGLLEQALLGEKLLQLALHDLVEDLRRLLLIRHLPAIDLALLLEHVAGHVLASDVGGIGGGDLHGEVPNQLAEGIRLGHEVGLAVDLHERAELAVGVAIAVHEAFLGFASLPLLGVREPLLPEEFGGRLEVAVRGVEGGLAVHHSRARPLAELHDGLGVGGHQDTSASALAISLSSSPSAISPEPWSLPSVPRPSLTASAMREVMSRTARMASSFPGIA